MLVLISLVACQSSPLFDAGDPSDLAPFSDREDELYSALADAGWDHVPGTYNVLFAAQPTNRRVVGLDLADSVGDGELVTTYDTFSALTLRMTYAEAQRLSARPEVLTIEPDWIATMSAPAGGTSCASSSSETTPTGVSAMGTGSGTGDGVKLAVLDTGIDNTHTDLSVAGLVDKVKTLGTGVDDNGHGTHVAATAAGLANSSGVVGVAPDVDLYGVKVLDKRGSGTYSTISSGIDWVVANGMDVANLSLGGSGSSSVLHTAVTAAYSADVVLVVAAGNSGTNTSSQIPAGYDGEVLTVSAVSVSSGTFPSWSNYGTAVDVAAHGVNVCSAKKGGGWVNMSGTSMSSPHVAGAVAVYLESHAGASFADVEAAIEGSVSALGDTSKHTEDLSVLTSL